MNRAVTPGDAAFAAAPAGAFVLTAGGDTAPRWSPGERLQHLFEAAADARPQAPAVETAAEALSFADLEAEANRLARLLSKHGFGAGDVVALLFDRDVEAYVAMLAVLKLNAIYVPLDPNLPGERVRYIVEDAKARAVLTLSAHAGLAAVADVPVFRLDALAGELAATDSTRFAPTASGTDLAYIIYTSGSTGRPKGVRILHCSIVHFIRVAVEAYGYRPGDRVYQGLTIAFDFSVEEIWVPLIAGATLVPSQSRASLVGSDLHAFLAERRITALCCVPTLLATVEDDLPDLRLLIVSGEACPEEIVRRWYGSGRVILNAYGPTEATVTATVARLRPEHPVTIGAPLPGYSIVILDPEAPIALPAGLKGEIGIAGVGLSPGYVGRDDLTAKAFVPDFLGLTDNPSGRIYRTGDLGWINAEGALQYHGRIDTQVKVRGYRIELTEIESVIMQQPGILQAVVDTFQPEPGTIELVAYYTAAEPVAPETVARSLETSLPSYMVPAYYEPVDSIAMLPSDKADRKALPPPSGRRLVRSTGEYVAPLGETEIRLAALLADLLKLERVSARDDFFDDLGANSLLMARFSTRIRSTFETDSISMRDIYCAPTVRALAARLGAAPTDAAPTAHVEAPHVASSLAYWATGLYQIVAAFLLGWATWSILLAGFGWVETPALSHMYLHAVLTVALLLVLSITLPVAAKWLLIGRWREQTFPVWGLDYARFWTVQTLVRRSPMVLLPGTPLYVAYLKALGARIDWSAMVMCPPPVCTDLVEIGARAVVGRGVTAQGYKAVGGRIVTGRIRIGADAYVGDGAVLDIDTAVERGAELGHASSLSEGQVAHAGLSYQGSPAELTSTRFRVLPSGRLSRVRRVGYTLAQIGAWVFVVGPAVLLALPLLAATVGSGSGAILAQGTIAALPALLGLSAVGLVATMAVGLAVALLVPRFAWLFLREGREYPLYGLRHFMLRTITSASNSKFFNLLFGDSSYVIYYLRALGYNFPELQQTGSNFGVEQRHDVPFLCEFGSGTMVSDGLFMANAEFSNAAFRLDRVRFGRDNFLGNQIIYPAGGKTGDNVLFGTKTMVPLDGPRLENTGILGSPSFQIPRSVQRDHRFEHYNHPAVLGERLRLKNRANLVTMGLFLAARYGLIVVTAIAGHALYFEAGLRSAAGLALGTLVLSALSLSYVVLAERASLGFRRLSPHSCSIYDEHFWRHERFWKLGVEAHLDLLNGTPFKPLCWRALGVRIGRKVFDEGCFMPEKSLVEIGDHCTLNAGVTIQAHSLEDGAFKSDRIRLGRGVTLGVRAFVHYGVAVGDEVAVEADSFLMKGESPAPRTRWRGNPARPISANRISEAAMATAQLAAVQS